MFESGEHSVRAAAAKLILKGKRSTGFIFSSGPTRAGRFRACRANRSGCSFPADRRVTMQDLFSIRKASGRPGKTQTRKAA
jgi:hypothetical protein